MEQSHYLACKQQQLGRMNEKKIATDSRECCKTRATHAYTYLTIRKCVETIGAPTEALRLQLSWVMIDIATIRFWPRAFSVGG